MTLPGEIAASVAPRHSQSAALLRRFRYAVSAADQIAISLLNFALTFCFLRVLSASEFGLVGLWLAVANLAISIHAALVAAPLGIHVPAEPDAGRRRRLGEAMASANLLVIAAAVVLVVVADSISDAEWAPTDLLVAAAIPLFIGAGLYREYYRAIAFGRHDMTLLLAVDAPYLLVTGGCVAAMLLWPQHFGSLAGAFIALALGTVAGQVCGGWQLRGRSDRPLRRGWRETYRGISDDIGWALTGVLFTHAQKRSYVYIATSIVGLAQLAALNAAAVLFRPTQILLTAWRRAVQPEFAAMVAAGQVDALVRRLSAALAVALAGCMVWFAVLWFGWQIIAQYLFAGKYPEAALLLLPWAVAVSLETADFVLGTALQAAREFRFLAGVTMVSAPVSALATAGLTAWGGIAWTIYGLAIGSAVSVVMGTMRLWRLWRGAIEPVAAAPGAVRRSPADL